MTAPGYVLTTPRLGLRPFVRGDAPALLGVFADPYAARFYPEMSDPERVADWIERNLQRYELHDLGLWAAERLEDGRLVGDAGLTYPLVEGTPRLEIGYHMHPDVRGQGLATEVARACLDYSFDRVGATFVCSIVDPGNVASARVAGRVHASVREFDRPSGRSLLFYTTG